MAGCVRPYCSRLVAFSSMVRSELSVERVETMLETASGSARRGSGPAISNLTVGVSAGVLSAVAAFLLDHQITPLSASRRKLAASKPLDFIAYLRLHQVIKPNPITASGKTTTLSQNVAFNRRLVMFSGRSSGDFGRIEIKSSSEESQLTMLTIKSRLPSERDPAMLFCAACEVPTTTKRPCGELLKVPATASVSGPFFPFVGSTAPRALIEVVATLASVVATSLESVVLLTDCVSSERDNG